MNQIRFLRLKKTIKYYDCKAQLLENSPFFGVIWFSLINVILTIILFIYMLKRRVSFFSYPVWNYESLNILILFLVKNLFENNITNNIEKLRY